MAVGAGLKVGENERNTDCAHDKLTIRHIMKKKCYNCPNYSCPNWESKLAMKACTVCQEWRLFDSVRVCPCAQFPNKMEYATPATQSPRVVQILEIGPSFFGQGTSDMHLSSQITVLKISFGAPWFPKPHVVWLSTTSIWYRQVSWTWQILTKCVYQNNT